MQKTFTKYLVLLLLILGIIFIFQRLQWLPSFSEIFKSKPVEIDNTAIVIKEVNALAQLVTITAYNEVVVEETIKGKPVFTNPLVPAILHTPYLTYPDKKLVLTGKGKVLAGINLAGLTAHDVYVHEDSAALKLPAVQLLQVIMNPSDFDIFEETGKWTDEEVKAVKIKLRDKLVSTVLKQNIVQKAQDKAKLVMEKFMQDAGFKNVTVTFAP